MREVVSTRDKMFYKSKVESLYGEVLQMKMIVIMNDRDDEDDNKSLTMVEATHNAIMTKRR